MRKIVVCYKWVRDDADILIRADRTLDVGKAKYKLNEYDRNSIELGVQLKAATGAELIGVTCGEDVASSTKDALSRGLDSVLYLDAPVSGKDDNRLTARALAAIIRSIQGVDLIICSEGSSDIYAQQTCGRLAAMLGFTSLSYVSAAKTDGEQLTVTRKLDDGTEDIVAPLPCAISVVPDVNDPPIPSVKQILGAKKKPATALHVEDLELIGTDLQPVVTTVSVLAPTTDRKKIRLNPDGVSMDDAAAKLVAQLTADGLL